MTLSSLSLDNTPCPCLRSLLISTTFFPTSPTNTSPISFCILTLFTRTAPSNYCYTLDLFSVLIETDNTNAQGLKVTLGTLYKGQGKFHLAEPLFVDCWQTNVRVWGTLHHATLSSLNSLAFLYYIQGINKGYHPAPLICFSPHCLPSTDSLRLTRTLTHSLTHSSTHSLTHSFTHSFIHSLTHSFTHSLTHPLTHSFTYPLTHSPTHSPTYPLAHSPTHPLTHSPTPSFSFHLSKENTTMPSPFISNVWRPKKRSTGSDIRAPCIP